MSKQPTNSLLKRKPTRRTLAYAAARECGIEITSYAIMPDTIIVSGIKDGREVSYEFDPEFLRILWNKGKIQ